MGATAAELQSLGHQENFFYLQHAMGLASSVGLGLALCLPQRQVVVFDGDGSVLMNLGGLTTLARYAPRNLVHVIFDNESLLSTGGFPTATQTGTDLSGIASAAGILKTQTVRTLEEFSLAFDDAMSGNGFVSITAKVQAIGPLQYTSRLSLLDNRFQFQRHVEKTMQCECVESLSGSVRTGEENHGHALSNQSLPRKAQNEKGIATRDTNFVRLADD
jgi:sulfopyruvate decarboxylase subunit beta